MKKHLLLFAFVLFSITAMASKWPTSSNKAKISKIIPKKCLNGTCTIGMTVSVTYSGGANIGIGNVQGSTTVTVNGSWSGPCSELIAAGKKLYKDLKEMLPKRASELEDGPTLISPIGDDAEVTIAGDEELVPIPQ